MSSYPGEPAPAPSTKPAWRAELSDAGQFSYAALCAVSLLELNGDCPSSRSFQDDCLKNIITQLQLAQSDQVLSSLRSLMRGEGSADVSPFIDLLRAEPVVERIGLQQVPEDLVTVAIKDGCYDARMRVLICRITSLLELNWPEVEDFERSLITKIKGDVHKVSDEERKEQEDTNFKRKVKKYTMIGLATVGGGALLGLTGGLAAPFLAAGAGAIIGGAGAAALGSVAGVAIIGSLFGVAGAGLSGYKMRKRVGDIEEFEFETLCEEGDLHVTIAITGWITENEPDFKSPWVHLSDSRDQYCLRYESEYLKNMGAAMDYLLSFAISAATQETLKYTVLSGLLAAVVWPATLLSASSIIDNPWSVCTHRTAAAGRQLADVLLAREQGKRPVTLVGFSLGARVIFYCLKEMSRRKNCEGIIQDAILLGAPVPGGRSDWEPFTKVVAGRIVNGYCKGDWLLRFLYRTASVQFSIAGLQPVKWNNRRMKNIDLSHIVNGHLDYWEKIDIILSVVGVRTVTDDMVCTATDAVKSMTSDSAEQWLMIEKRNSHNTPSSGAPTSGIESPTTESNIGSQFTDVLNPSRTFTGQASQSSDSGFVGRDSELDSVASGLENLALDPSRERPRGFLLTNREESGRFRGISPLALDSDDPFDNRGSGVTFQPIDNQSSSNRSTPSRQMSENQASSQRRSPFTTQNDPQCVDVQGYRYSGAMNAPYVDPGRVYYEEQHCDPHFQGPSQHSFPATSTGEFQYSHQGPSHHSRDTRYRDNINRDNINRDNTYNDTENMEDLYRDPRYRQHEDLDNNYRDQS